jgi:hypothetical protein
MTVDKVRPLRGDMPTNLPNKQQALDYVAQRWDELAADGKAPVCIVFALVAESGAAASHYLTASHIEEGNTLYVSRAVMVVNSDYNDWTR